MTALDPEREPLDAAKDADADAEEVAQEAELSDTPRDPDAPGGVVDAEEEDDEDEDDGDEDDTA